MSAFTAARAELALLTINRLAITGTSSSPNYAHAEKLLRQDALAVLARLEAAVTEMIDGIVQENHEWLFSLKPARHQSSTRQARKRIEQALAEVAIGEQARPSYCPGCGTPIQEHCEMEGKDDE